jgi:tight adherence protein B
MTLSPILILGLGGGLALILLVVGVVVSVNTERATVQERLGKYVEKENLQEKTKATTTPLTDWIDRRVEKSTAGEKIRRDLARADIRMKVGEFIALTVISAFLVGVLAWLIGSKSILLGGVGIIAGIYLPRVYVKRQQGRRLLRFNDQLGDMLNLMVNGLRAGYSIMQAMESISKELPSPISDEFRRVVQEMQLGVSMEKALDNLLRRIPSDDLDLIVTAVNVQREVGGNLAEILDTISYTIRERVRIKGEIRVMTSQTMYSGKFLSLMPIIVIGILYLLNRPYMMEFFNKENIPCGYIALGIGGLLIGIGYFVMNKIAAIEV